VGRIAASGQLPEQRERAAVGPLQVVEDHHQAARLGERFEQRNALAQHAKGRRLQRHRLRHDVRQPAGSGPCHRLPQLRRIGLAGCQAAQHFAQQAVRLGVSVTFDAGGAQQQRRSRVAVRRPHEPWLEGLQQSRLADAGLAGDGDHLAAPGAGGGERLEQPLQLVAAADEGPFGCRGRRAGLGARDAADEPNAAAAYRLDEAGLLRLVAQDGAQLGQHRAQRRVAHLHLRPEDAFERREGNHLARLREQGRKQLTDLPARADVAPGAEDTAGVGLENVFVELDLARHPILPAHLRWSFGGAGRLKRELNEN